MSQAQADIIDRTSMNTSERPRLADRVNAIGKPRIVLAVFSGRAGWRLLGGLT